MCGIVGLVRKEALTDDDLVRIQRMTDTLRHRGPDADGVVTIGSAALGHRRLSIVDLSERAAQPMLSDDGKVALVWNGEAYNHLELRRELEPTRGPFRSDSDTEAVLRGFLEWDEGVVDRLNGMFALGLWDDRSRRLFLARDRYGQKPLYYMRLSDGGLAFASELRALRQLPGNLELDRRSIAKYLAFDAFPLSTSVYAGVRKLPPGSTLLWEDGRITVRRYWRKRYGTCSMDVHQAEEELWRLLRQAVERRLMADVPLGVFLSGGVDSSAILAAMAEITDPKRIRTFAIGFREKSFDESEAAAEVANHFGVQHAVRVLDEKLLLEMLPEILDHLDEPLADVSVVPTYALSKFAREEVTVALGGDGGDELFAGYDIFLAERIARPYMKVPSPIRSAVKFLVNQLPPSDKRMSFQFKARRFVRGLDKDPVARSMRWFGSFLPEETTDVMVDGPRADEIYEDLAQLDFPEGEQGPLELWTGQFLPDQVLTKVDRASMAVSLEVRAPFLDPELAAFAHSLPYHYKFRGLTRKWLLKRVLAGKLPPGILERKKQGFTAPNGEWLRGPLRREVSRLLDPQALARGGLLRPEPVQRLLQEHLDGRRDHRKKLWTLYVLLRWLERQ